MKLSPFSNPLWQSPTPYGDPQWQRTKGNLNPLPFNLHYTPKKYAKQAKHIFGKYSCSYNQIAAIDIFYMSWRINASWHCVVHRWFLPPTVFFSSFAFSFSYISLEFPFVFPCALGCPWFCSSTIFEAVPFNPWFLQLSIHVSLDWPLPLFYFKSFWLKLYVG